MKQYIKGLVSIILICLYLSSYAESFDVLNGAWYPQFSYDAFTTNQLPTKFGKQNLEWGNAKQSIGHFGGILISLQSDGTGYYRDDAPYYYIHKVEQQGDKEFLLYGYPPDFDDYPSENKNLFIVSIFVLDEDSILITYLEGFGSFGPIYDEPWYRISGPAKIPEQYGVLNDTRVRLRTKPNIESDTWGFLNTGDEVTIIDESAEKQQIGDMEDYWYKVQTELFPDGWVYGAFIDIEN